MQLKREVVPLIEGHLRVDEESPETKARKAVTNPVEKAST